MLCRSTSRDQPTRSGSSTACQLSRPRQISSRCPRRHHSCIASSALLHISRLRELAQGRELHRNNRRQRRISLRIAITSARTSPLQGQQRPRQRRQRRHLREGSWGACVADAGAAAPTGTRLTRPSSAHALAATSTPWRQAACTHRPARPAGVCLPATRLHGVAVVFCHGCTAGLPFSERPSSTMTHRRGIESAPCTTWPLMSRSW